MKTVKTPSALDFARMFGSLDYSVLPQDKVAEVLRNIADLMERKHKPSLFLMEAHSMENVAAEETSSITLLRRTHQTSSERGNKRMATTSIAFRSQRGSLV
jgi:hypothetical protein